MKAPIMTSHLAAFGRASYVTRTEAGMFELHPTEATQRRANVTAQVFDEQKHTQVLCAGGFPGIAQQWPPEHIPPHDRREAHFLGQPLVRRLRQAGWTEAQITARIRYQGDSNNSIGDVLESIRKGYLNPDDFNQETPHGIDVVSGLMHFIRFRAILQAGLDVNPNLIRRVPMRDVYGTPKTQFRPAEHWGVAVAKEVVAIGLTMFVLRDVRPGEIDDLAAAEEHFNAKALKAMKA